MSVLKNMFKNKITKVIIIIFAVLIGVFILVGFPIQIVRAIHKVAALMWEEKDLSHGISGYVLEAHGDSLTAFNLKNKSTQLIKTVPKESFSDGWRIFDVTGPSRDGKIVYLLTNSWNKQTNSWDEQTVCVLRMCDLQGLNDVVLADKFSVESYTSQHLAISPDGKLLATLFHRAKQKDFKGERHPETGVLEIFRVPAMEKVKEIPSVADENVSWFPDSSSILFAMLEGKRSVIKKLKIESGEILSFGQGRYQRISPDGSKMAYLDLENNHWDLKIMNLDNNGFIRSPLTKKDKIIGIIGLVDPNRILYVGITTGMLPSKIQNGSISLKIADVNKGTFETLHIFEAENCGGYSYAINEEVSYGVLE